jgi:hypothetical protein
MTERTTESGQTGTNPEEAAELARKGMAKGTAGASETGSEYEQGGDTQTLYFNHFCIRSCSSSCLRLWYIMDCL